MKFFPAIKNKKQAGIILIMILSISFLIKLILAFTIHVELRSDSLVYDTLAKNLLFLGQYFFDGKITAALPPGYPIFLAFVYYFFQPEQIYVKIVQSLFEIFTIYLFYRVCLNFFNVRIALMAAAIFAFLPSNILYSQTILTEPLFGLFAMIILFYCIEEKIDRKIILIGIIWGAAILIRSSFAFSIILLPLFIFIYRKKIFEGYKKSRMIKSFRYSLLFLAGAALIISTWMIRNNTAIGSPTLATQGGFTFWTGNNPDATGTWYFKYDETDTLFKMEDEAERDRAYYKKGLNFIYNNPDKFLLLAVKKIAYLFSSERIIVLYFMEKEDTSVSSTEIYRLAKFSLIALVNIPYFFVILFGTWGLFLLKKKRFFIYGFIISWLVTAILFFGLSRYHYVLIPFFIIGFVNFILNRKNFLNNLSVAQKVSIVLITFFFISVWFMEFYLLFF
jgi:4-amino-4-deoxy-L-arabinose transferase-like glycosyltransferase